MAKYNHITRSERQEISILLNKGYSHGDIGRALGRDTSTIGREIERNSVVINGKGPNPEGEKVYIPDKADHKKYVRRKYCKIQFKKITSNNNMENYIIEKIQLHWSPEQIANRWNEKNPDNTMSHMLIYNYIYSARGNKYHQYLYKKRHTKKRRKGNKGKREIIKNRTWIDDRPDIIAERKRFGDFEGDLIVSKKGDKTVLLTTVERVSRLLLVRKSPNKKPLEIEKRIIDIQKEIDDKMISITLDNGIEFQSHENYNCEVYFCHPYSSWEKGQIEYANRMIRRFIPKKSNISDYSEEEIQGYVDMINNTPRKCLNYKTPIEVYNENINKEI